MAGSSKANGASIGASSGGFSLLTTRCALCWRTDCYTVGMTWLDEVKWDDRGLVPAIAQEDSTGDVLMVAWMNREALSRTAETGEAVYFSRSRNKLWHKGEESGHIQKVHAIRLDCDADVILLRVTQMGHEPGIACHTGRHSCFFQKYDNGQWVTVDAVIKDPTQIYA
jgi:phosphoribosyl-AMP cyclohydrolase